MKSETSATSVEGGQKSFVSEKQEHSDQESQTAAPKAHWGSDAPDGGFAAWLQVFCGFMLMFNTWGVVNTFGEFLSFYESPGSIFHEPASSIAWLGSMQAFLLLFTGAVAGPLYDAGFARTLIWTGTFLVVFGHMMLSICNAYWQAFLAQGLCVGLGLGLLFIPAVAVISTYFHKKVATAIGIAASGSSIGGIIYPIVFHRLEPQIGFGWTTRVIGFMIFATLLFPCAFMKPRVKPQSTRALIDVSAFREPPYLVFVVFGFFGFTGLLVNFFYIQYFAVSQGLTDANLGFYLLAILNAASIFGRIIPNIIADKVGHFNVLAPSAVISAVLIFCLLAVDSEAGVIVITVLFGFFSGTFVSIVPTCFVSLTPDRRKIGTRIGQGMGIMSFGMLIGAPIAGAILGDDANWTGVWVFSGVMVMAGAGGFAATRLMISKGRLHMKI